MREDTPFIIPDHSYLTIPLAALPMLRSTSTTKETNDSAESLIRLGIDRMAQHFDKKYTRYEMLELQCLHSYKGLKDWIAEAECSKVDYLRHYALACWFLGIIPGDKSFSGIMEGAIKAESIIKPYERGTRITFSVLKRDLFDLRDGKMLLRDFLVLAAIRSILGRRAKQNAPRRITRDQIAARIAGFARPADVPDSLGGELFEEAHLKRIGRTAVSLARRERFTRWTANKRETYYHVSKSEEEIADYVSAKKNRAAKKRIAAMEAELKYKQQTQQLREDEQALREKLVNLNSS